MRKRHSSTINSSSTSDIAFLLLVFFLLSSTIINENGIRVNLPEKSPEPPTEILGDQLLTITLRGDNGLYLNDEKAQIYDLKGSISSHFRGKDYDHQKSLLLISSDYASYDFYIDVVDEIKASYVQLWETASMELFGNPLKDLDDEERNAVMEKFPLNFSERSI